MEQQLSEWNNQPRIKRPLVPYAGTTDAGRSSKYSASGAGPNNGDRDNYCNYRRNSKRGKDTPWPG